MIKKLFLSTIAILLFSLNSSAQSISMIGDAVSGWSTDVVMSTTDNVNYTLSNFTFSNGGAKFRKDASWGTNWGANAFPSGTASLNGSNIPVIAGVYNVSFNISTKAFSFSAVATGFDAISISGTAGPGLNSDTAMLTVDGINYSLNNCALTAGTLLFRKNNSSAVTWGSASFPSGTATQGGAAMVVTPGTYNITFNKATGAYSFAFATIGIIGDATAGGWNTDTLMNTTDGVNYTLEGVTLTTGSLKFRQNQSWTINWGANTFPIGTATLNGDNISVTAGTYSVSFNKNTGAFNFSAGYPAITLTSRNAEAELITLDGVNYYLNNYTIAAGNYLFKQTSPNINSWGTNSFPAGTATLGGATIPVVAGDYNISFNKSTGVFSFNYLTISVIGNATPGGWDADTNLTSTDGVNYSLSGLALSVGELKFRQGNDWSVNWGSGSFPGGTAYNNDSNIAVSTASNYTVNFNRTTGAFYFYDEVNLQVTSTVNICKGSTPTSLSAHVHAVPGSIVKCYTRGGTVANPTYTLMPSGVPTPATTTIGTKTYYMSQTIGGIEGPKVAMIVNVVALPTTPTTLTGTAAQGPLVGTTTTATYATTAVTGAASYLWTVPTGVTIVSGQGTTSLVVNFENVSAGAGAIGAISVKAVNDNGCSGAAKSLSLTKALPAAPGGIKMTDAALPVPTSGIATAVTSFAKYMGTSRVVTLTATASATASSYDWELPTGVNQLSGGTSNVITVNFLGVTNSNTFNYSSTTGVSTNALRIGVKSRNGVGVSTTNNAALLNPTTDSTAKLLTLTAVKPAAVSAVAGQIAGLCGGSTYTYTITDTALASSYTVAAPAGAVVNFTSTLVFTVTYPVGFVVNATTTVPNKSLVITSVNGMGSSATSKTLTLSTAMAAIGTVSGGTTYSSCDQTFSIPAVAGASTYTWTVPTGATIVSGQNTNSVVVNYGSLTGSQTIKVLATNACGISTALKTVTLTRGNCPTAKQSEVNSALVNEVTLYPNPATNVFNVELNASVDAQMEMTVYSMNGSLVTTKNIQVTEGNNTITEDISSLSTGIYFVKFTNTSSNDTIIKKLIKE
jgi:hypothetical protein